MKSKKSCFNPTIFWKSIRLAWPIWTLYTVALILLMPLSTGIRFSYISNNIREAFVLTKMLQALESVACPTYLLILSSLVALVIAVVNFYYLNQSRSANMMHSLPVSRTELYITNILSGLTVLVVPIILAFILTVIVCMIYHVPGMLYLMEWCLCGIGLSVLMFSIAVFCVFLAGHSLAVVFYYFLINFIYHMFRYAFALYVGFMGYGMYYSTVLRENSKLGFLSPIVFLYRRLGTQSTTEMWDEEHYLVRQIHLVGGKYVAYYLIVAVVFYVVSWYMYKKRKLELAGDMVAVPFLRPIMRWLLGTLSGLLVGYLVYQFFNIANIIFNTPVLLLISIICAIIGFLASQMILQKSFKIFKSRFMLEFACFGLYFVLVLTGLYKGSCAIERARPSLDDVEYVSIYGSYQLSLKGDEVQIAYDLQDYLINHENELYQRQEIEGNNGEKAISNIEITYHLKDESTISRSYNYVIEGAGEAFQSKLRNVEMEPNHFRQFIYSPIYENLGKLSAVNMQFFVENEENVEESFMSEWQLDESMYDDLIKAIDADIDEGNLQMYSLASSGVTYNAEDCFFEGIELVFTCEDRYPIGDGTEYQAYDYESFSFIKYGKSCTHILQFMLDNDLIYSVEGLMTEADYNELYGY